MYDFAMDAVESQETRVSSEHTCAETDTKTVPTTEEEGKKKTLAISNYSLVRSSHCLKDGESIHSITETEGETSLRRREGKRSMRRQRRRWQW